MHDHEKQEFSKEKENNLYGMTIDRTLADKIATLRATRKLLNNNIVSTKEWLKEAIEEKLNRDEEKENPSGDFKLRSIKIPLSQDLKNRLENRIKQLKQEHYGFSTRRWVMSAVFEKILEEELSNQKALQIKFSTS